MEQKKTVMFVEASNDMLPWFKRAREFGYRSVVCGTDDSKEMAREADAYYVASYSDRQKCIEIARKERVDGVIGGGDQSALTAAYVAKALSLPGNDPEGLERMMNKQKFRQLQKELGLKAPDFVYASELDSFLEQVQKLSFPVIVKPGQMSSSRGVKVFHSFEKNALSEHFILCKGLSYNEVVCAEQYLEIPDGVDYEFVPFVCGERVIWAGDMLNFHSRFCREVPSGGFWPMPIPQDMRQKAENDILMILRATNFKFGEVDVESFFTPDGDFIILEINPRRCGGGMQKYIQYSSDKDYVGMLVSLSAGDPSFFDKQYETAVSTNPISVFFVYSDTERVFNDIYVAEELNPYLSEICFLKEKGSSACACRNFYDALAKAVFHFPSTDIQKKYVYRMEDLVKAI